jgi:hypothetical protein
MPTRELNSAPVCANQMDQSEEDKKALKQFDRTTKFDELSQQNAALIQKIRKLIETEIKLQ